MGKTSDKAVASLSNGFALLIPDGRAVLVISFVNCRSRRVQLGPKRGGLGVILGSSTRRLSRVMIVKCKARGGSSLADSMRIIHDSSLLRVPAVGVSRTLDKRMTNLRMVTADNSPDATGRSGVRVHKVGNTPLLIVSNIPHFKAGSSRNRVHLSSLGPSSVRDVSMLGSNTTTTICNTHTTGKIVLIRAGHTTNGRGVSIGCEKRFGLRRTAHLPRFLGTCRCTGLCGHTVRGATSPRGLPCASRRLRVVHARSGPGVCNSRGLVSCLSGFNCSAVRDMSITNKGDFIGCCVSNKCAGAGKLCDKMKHSHFGCSVGLSTALLGKLILSLSVAKAHSRGGGADCSAVSTTCGFSPLRILQFAGKSLTDIRDDGPLVTIRNLNKCVQGGVGVGAVATALGCSVP